MSTSSPLASRLNGIASSAPSGPSTHAQNISETNDTVTDRPTASPTIFGWMIDWITKLTRQYRTMTSSIRSGPPSSSPSSAGGISPMTNPTLGM
jgi:hypothetical protein